MSQLWYVLGVQLKVRISRLNGIQAQFLDNTRQLLEMLKTWLTTSDNTTWKTLTDALRTLSVGAHNLAGRLETKYCLVRKTEVDSGTSTWSEANVTPPTPASELMASAPQPGVAEGMGYYNWRLKLLAHITLYTQKTPRGVINLHVLNDKRRLQASWLRLSLITAQGE